MTETSHQVHAASAAFFRERNQAENRSNRKINTKGHEPCAPSKKRIPIAENKERDRSNSGNQTGKHSKHSDACPVKAQHHARKELSNARIAQQKKRYQRCRAVDREVETDKTDRH